MENENSDAGHEEIPSEWLAKDFDQQKLLKAVDDVRNAYSGESAAFLYNLITNVAAEGMINLANQVNVPVADKKHFAMLRCIDKIVEMVATNAAVEDMQAAQEKQH